MVKKKYSIGYQLPKNDSIPSIVRDFEENISEVYFAFPGVISARPTLEKKFSKIFWKDIRILEKMDIDLVALFNFSFRDKYKKISAKEIIDRYELQIKSISNLTSIVTTDESFTKEIKKRFPNLKIRMSVNAGVKTLEEIKRTSDLYDEYTLPKDPQRNIQYVKDVYSWCKRENKKLHILVNSGCRYEYSLSCAKITKRNEEMELRLNVPCKKFFSEDKNKHYFFRGSWIRPEDVHNYEPYCDAIKLATRSNDNPRLVVRSYINQKYLGNLLDLMEPSFSKSFSPDIVDNQKFPKEWFKKTKTCKRNCDSCKYCENVFEKTKN